MPLQSKGGSSNLRSKTIERPSINRRETSLEGPSLILSAVKEAATLAPFAELKKVACTALLVYKTAQKIKEDPDKMAYDRLSYDSNGFIATIWSSFKKAEDPKGWRSAEVQYILEDLSRILENILSFICERLSKSKVIRVISSRDDGVKINEYREQLHYAMDRFKHQSHTNIKNDLIRVLKKKDQIIEQILHRNEEAKQALEFSDGRDQEIAEQFQEEKWEISKLEQLKQVEIECPTEYSDELKRIKEAKDRESELERLRAAACELEEANRLKKAEEEKIAQLKRALASEEDNRRSNKIRARTSEKKSTRQEDEEWEGNFIAEEVSEEEEERPVRRGSRIKRNTLESPKRRLVALEYSTDDDEEDLQSTGSTKARMARRNLSSTSLRFQEKEYDSPEEEDDYAPPPSRKSPKVKRNPQTSSRTLPLPRISEDLTAHFHQEIMQMVPGSPPWSGPGSPIYVPGMHSNPMRYSSFPLSIGHYGYGLGMPGTGSTITTTPQFKRTRGYRDQHLPQYVGHNKRASSTGSKSG